MSNFKKVIIFGIVAAIVQALMGLAYAKDLEHNFATLDKDKDGLISLRESTANIELLKNFNKVDLNGDGFISQKEFSISASINQEF
ncbi:calcium-binding protein [Glaciecola sp. 1036]|uniref:calcium-binding protein n=1 Tax=Alteromonadaceae TaxID=72275 RepID=UPI003D070315